MEFDILTFLLNGADNVPPVVFLVLGLTYFAGLLGLKGKGQLVFAFALGVILGAGLQIAQLGVPQTFAAWFWLVVYALVLALVPSLIYEQAKDIVWKVLSKIVPGLNAA